MWYKHRKSVHHIFPSSKFDSERLTKHFVTLLQVTLPVYLNFTRSDLIFTVDFDIATKEDPHSFYERGVAVLCTE